MGKVGTFLLVAGVVAISATIAQAAELELGKAPSISYHHRQALGRCAFVQGVRGGTPLSVPFFARGWSPGPTYEVGWQHCACCTATEPVISAKY